MKYKPLRIGNAVRHTQHGLGKVMNIRKDYAGFNYLVDFDDETEPQWYLRSALELL